MANSQNAASSGCFSGILRRFLCAGSVPTHPSDHFGELNSPEPKNSKQNAPSAETQLHFPAAPGIVARLMGLESLPGAIHLPHPMKRCRSLNFGDHSLQLDPTMRTHHRRVRTSVSFQEIDTFSDRKIREFSTPCFGELSSISEGGLTVRESEMGSLEILKQQKKVERRERKEEEERENGGGRREKQNRISFNCSSRANSVLLQEKNVHRKPNNSTPTAKKPLNRRKITVKSKSTEKRKNQSEAKKSGSVLKSKKSSPVSLVDIHYSPTCSVPFAPLSGNKDLNWRKNCSPRKVNFEYPYQIMAEETEYCIKLVDRICNLTEEEVNCSWVVSGELGIEEICMELGEQVLELMLDQVVDELLELHGRYKN